MNLISHPYQDPLVIIVVILMTETYKYQQLHEDHTVFINTQQIGSWTIFPWISDELCADN